MSGRKENFVTLRIDDASLKFMESICQKFSFTKSKLIRHAVQYYIQFVLSGNTMTNPKMMVSQEIFSTIIDNLSPAELKEVAKVSFEGSLKNNEFDEMLANERNATTNAEKFEIILENLEKYKLSKQGQNWFDSFSHKWKEDSLILKGSHPMGKKYSEFACYLLEIYGLHFQFYVDSQNFDEKSIQLVLKERSSS